MIILTKENAKNVSTVKRIAHPEWGYKAFHYDYSGRGHHSWGQGCNGALLFESDFHFFEVNTFKEKQEIIK
jgi:hypothetical protein